MVALCDFFVVGKDFDFGFIKDKARGRRTDDFFHEVTFRHSQTYTAFLLTLIIGEGAVDIVSIFFVDKHTSVLQSLEDHFGIIGRYHFREEDFPSHIVFGLAVNLRVNRFDWTSHAEIVKQGASLSITMLVSMLSLIPICILQFLLGAISPYLGFAIVGLILLVLIFIAQKIAYTGVEQRLLKM